MKSLFINRKLYSSALRLFSTKVKPITTLDEDVAASIENEEYKPRHHPGVNKQKIISLPEKLIRAIECAVGDYPIKKLHQDGVLLTRHLKGRKLPVEREFLITSAQNIENDLLERFESKKATADENNVIKQNKQDKVQQILKQRIYNWKSINYNVYNSLVYLISRVVPEYAVLSKIFREIQNRDESFQPKSLFDFGSGVGTATWAANAFWKYSLFEYYNVDASENMNDLAQILLQDGRGNQKMDLRGVSYRQFLPATNIPYDLVISAYSLLELPSLQTRLEIIKKLWNKTNKYLILVEHGTLGGFECINEVREFILKLETEHNSGHIFSPCPHENICPLSLAKNTPCYSTVKYFSLPIGAKSESCSEKYSYVVFKKGSRDVNDPQWPRVIEQPLIRSKHTICRLCTTSGKFQEIIFTASRHGKQTYHCARSTKLGDRLPVSIKLNSEETSEVEESEET